jgi:hypothetical protein
MHQSPNYELAAPKPEAHTEAVEYFLETMVTDIAVVVRQVRFPDWQNTTRGA